MDQDLQDQLREVLAAVRQILPKPVPPIDWTVTLAANWRRHSLAGYLEPMQNLDNIQLDDLLGIEAQKLIVENNTRQFLGGVGVSGRLAARVLLSRT
jgi:predicted AAA+ superfamily ATPase